MEIVYLSLLTFEGATYTMGMWNMILEWSIWSLIAGFAHAFELHICNIFTSKFAWKWISKSGIRQWITLVLCLGNYFFQEKRREANATDYAWDKFQGIKTPMSPIMLIEGSMKIVSFFCLSLSVMKTCCDILCLRSFLSHQK